MEIVSAQRSLDGALNLKLLVGGEVVPYIYRADDPYRMVGLDDLVGALDIGTIPVENIDDDPDPAPSLTPRQLRLVMLNIGLSDDDVDAQILAIEDGTERAAAVIEWRWATNYERNHWLVEHLRLAMGFDEGEFDDLWIWGASL